MKILYVTTISLTINSFFKPHIEMLVNEGHQVDVACNYSDLPIDDFYETLGCKNYQIDFSRTPISTSNIEAYKQLKKVIEEGGYDIVHCHTPNASVITRLVCRKFRKTRNLKVFYTAHGFHFYKGAPLANWIVYYPIEKLCSYFTDKIITINEEDYNLACNKLRAQKACYIPGMGVDINKFKNTVVDRELKREELNIPREAYLLLSVGELNANKNHEVIVRALGKMNNPNIHYAIAGTGPLGDYLLEVAKSIGVEEQLHLLAYRNDVNELCKIADLFCFPSMREGLGLAAVEASASGLYVIAADTRGTRDIIKEDSAGILAKTNSAEEYALLIKNNISKNVLLDEAESIKRFDIEHVKEILKKIYVDN